MIEIIIGIALGYFFKPQIDKFVVKVIRQLRDERKKRDDFE